MLSAGAVTKQVDRLEKQGYVERIREHGVRGQRLVALTVSGVHVTNEVQDRIATSFGNIAPTVSALSAEKFGAITNTLQQLLDEGSSSAPIEATMPRKSSAAPSRRAGKRPRLRPRAATR